MKKWLDKYKDVPEAENGIEGTMGGLTDKGFNYNGAWGGTMAMGGSLPGSVGFTYARTQDPAPSKGKYAKKTMASAQNGQEMKFYQEGLDWKPKTISRDGSSLPQAQSGAQLSVEDQAILQDRKNRIKASVAARENGTYTKDNWRQQLADESQAIGDKFRIFPDDPNSIIDEYFNPAVAIGSLAADLGSAPLRAQQEDSYLPYASAIATPLITGALEGWGVKSNKQFAKNIINPFNFPGQETIKKYLGKGVDKVSKAAGNFAQDFSKGYKSIPTREDGGIIEDDLGQWAHPGEITKINSNQITMQGVDYPVLGISDTGDTQMMQPGQDYTYEGESVTEIPMMQKGGKASLRSLMNDDDDLKSKSDATKVVPQKTMTKEQAAKLKARKDAEELQRRKQAIKTSKEARNKPFSVQNLADESGAIGDKFRMFPNDPDSFIDEYINPGVMVGNMASGLGRVPLNLQEGNYGEAAMSVAQPLVSGALAGYGVEGAGQFANNVLNPLAGASTFLKSGMSYLDNKYIIPIQYRKEIKYLTDLNTQYKNKYLSDPELGKRLSVLNINPEYLDEPGLTFSNIGSHYDADLNNINIDFRQSSNLKRKKYELNPRTIYEHEYGHFLQREGYKNSPEYLEELKNYNRAKSQNSFPMFNPEIPVPFPIPTKIDKYAKNLYDYDYTQMPSQLNQDLPEIAKKNSLYFGYRDVEPLAHLREMRQNMINKGYIKNISDPIDEQTIAKFIEKNPKDRIASFSTTDDKTLKGLAKIFRNLPAAIPVAIAASQENKKQKNGGWLSKYN